VEYFVYELGRNKVNAFAVADHEIAGHDRDTADADRNVDAGEHDVVDGRRIHIADVRGHVNFGDAVEVANAAVNDQTTAVGGAHRVVEEIVADDRAANFLAEEIDDQDVARLEHVDGELVGQAR